MIRYLIFVALLITFSSCSNDDELSRDSLNEQLNEILAMAESVPCEDSADWRIVGLGAKPCGGPSSFIAYSVAINTETFLELVEQYNSDSKAFNEREGLISDCAIVLQPNGVICENGSAILVYEPL